MNLFTELRRLGIAIVRFVPEETDRAIRNSVVRWKNWNVVRTDIKELVTTFGAVQYRKTYYRKKADGRHVYLLNEVLGFSPDMWMTDAAGSRILTEAEQTSYRKGGEEGDLELTTTDRGSASVKYRLSRLNKYVSV